MRMMAFRSQKCALMAAVSVLALTCSAYAQDDGFAISIGGKPVAGDRTVADAARRTDVARSKADIRVQADGLGVRPRLDLEVVSVGRGEAVVQSRMNYPAWIARAEVRITDLVTGRLIDTVAIDPNGRATIALPEGDFTAVHRVYDAQGRFDETASVALGRAHSATEEQGIDRAANRRIPVTGGAVTVSGTGLAPGATVQTLGETLRPDASGDFVIQRILPPGDRAVPVRITGGGENIYIESFVSIPKSEWFTVATADLTFGKILAGPRKGETYSLGRLAYYTKGKTVNGWEITSSADTGEDDLKNIFRDFDRKDPLGVLSRLDPDLAYPVYGDDSTIENDAPTAGKFYFRAQKDNSYVLWGNYKGRVTGAQYLRNERTLYGFQGVYSSPEQTTRGQARIDANVYAAQPDMLPGREVFLGTGGSVYFLRRQDISIGTETLTIELRDPISGRVLQSRALVAGRDYSINYIQGLITLAAPLSSTSDGGLITPPAGSARQARLVAQYEYTPTSGDIDGFAYGGRVQGWVTDQLRLGVTAMVEQTDTADQAAAGVDVRYEFGTNSFVEAEVARTDGPGFGQTYSADGGLIITSNGAGAGTGQAVRFKAQVDLADLGLATKGSVGAYFEDKNAGFSTLDANTSIDEQSWGIAADIAASERLSYRVAYDGFEDAAGKRLNKGSASLKYKSSDRLAWELGLASEDRVEVGDVTKTGSRTDLAAKATFTPSDALLWYVFGQATIARTGGLDRNDRAGVGAEIGFSDNWTFKGEVSGGTAGAGARALINYENEGSTAYFGYTLDPARELNGVTLNGRDNGQFVLGGRRDISESTTIYGENTYDLFGRHRSLTSTYGVDYTANKALTLSGSLELGRVEDPVDDFDRRALSLGMTYQNEAGLQAKARLELRQDRGTAAGSSRDADTILFGLDAAYTVNPSARWLLSFDAADTKTDGSSVLSGEYAKASIGYALRPVDDDRFNMLVKYTYLYDMYGQRIDGSDQPGPRQQSHVFSLDATYDVSQQWTLGGKLGFRLGTSSPDSVLPLVQNDAALVVLNARYHLTNQWDVLLEGRALQAPQAGVSEFGALATVYRQVGQNVMVGLGYNFGSFSDDLNDLTQDDQGLFLNLVAKF